MSLRPRYSLLTLLLLTAAVAVGFKLWRGPHRVTMDNKNPSSASAGSEYFALEGLLFLNKNGQDRLCFEFERSFFSVNRGTISYTFGKPVLLVLRREDDKVEKMILRRPADTNPQALAAEFKERTNRTVTIVEQVPLVGWVSEGFPHNQSSFHYGTLMPDQIALPELPLYFVASSGKIYAQLKFDDLESPYLPVDLETLPPSALKTRLLEQLKEWRLSNKIP